MPAANSATQSPAADSTDSLVFLGEQEATEFSYWEIINQSDADSDTDSLHSVENGFLSWYSLKSPDSGEEIEAEPVLEGRVVLNAADLAEASVEMDDDCNSESEEIDEQDEEEMDDDDEVVAWNLRGKFGGRQRMRKLGKRFCSKMTNSKRDRYAHVKRGCVHGKRD